MELPFITLDVFTRSRYTGNPLAVVTIPASGPKPTQEQKQTIAREFNLSETIFIHDVSDPETNKTRHVDIFLTTAELPFAGHPTIGASVSLLPQGVNQLITKAGPIAITQTGPDSASANIPHNVRLHKQHLADIAESLGPFDLQSNPKIRPLELSAPVFSIVKGTSFALIQLPSLELLSQVRVTNASVPAHVLDPDWQEGLIGFFYYVRTDTSTTEDGTPVVHLRTRMVTHGFEDPATGAASCALTSYLSIEGDDKQTTPKRRYELTQGVEMGRESNIVVEVSLKESGGIDTVALSGPAVQVMRGHVTI